MPEKFPLISPEEGEKLKKSVEKIQKPSSAKATDDITADKEETESEEGEEKKPKKPASVKASSDKKPAKKKDEEK